MKGSAGRVIRRIAAAAGIAVMMASMAGCGGSGANVNAQELADALWAALDTDNKVSLYVEVGGESVIINKYE